MSEEEKAYQRAELRSILVSVPIKAIVAGLLVNPMAAEDANFLGKAFVFVVAYSMLSIYAYVSKMVGNWILGLIVLIVCMVLLTEIGLPSVVETLVEWAFVCGGFSLDVYRIIKYIRLSIRKS